MCPKELIEEKHSEDRNKNKIYASSLINAIELLNGIEDPMVESLSILHKAAKYGNSKLVKYFIKKGYEVNIQSGPKKLTPLHIAAMVSNYEAINVLLENGANPFLETSIDCMRPIQYVGLFNLLNKKTLRISIRKNFPQDNDYVIEKRILSSEEDQDCIKLIRDKIKSY